MDTAITLVPNNSIFPVDSSVSSTCDLSNCQQDVDTFLYNFKFIAPVQPNEPLHLLVPSSAIRSLIVIFNPHTLHTVEEENIIIYIAVYISHKSTTIVCSKGLLFLGHLN